jgi:hypothetical protein
MPSTTIHFPDDILSDIDRSAERKNMSRNKFVISACKAALAREAGEWSEGFFDNRFSSDKAILKEAVGDMERAIYAGRQNRGIPMV